MRQRLTLCSFITGKSKCPLRFLQTILTYFVCFSILHTHDFFVRRFQPGPRKGGYFTAWLEKWLRRFRVERENLGGKNERRKTGVRGEVPNRWHDIVWEAGGRGRADWVQLVEQRRQILGRVGGKTHKTIYQQRILSTVRWTGKTEAGKGRGRSEDHP